MCCICPHIVRQIAVCTISQAACVSRKYCRRHDARLHTRCGEDREHDRQGTLSKSGNIVNGCNFFLSHCQIPGRRPPRAYYARSYLSVFYGGIP